MCEKPLSRHGERFAPTLDVHHRAYQSSIAPHTSTHGPGLVDCEWQDRQLATARPATKKELFP